MRSPAVFLNYDSAATGPPDFVEILANCTAELGQTVKLACKATGVPKPQITWYKGTYSTFHHALQLFTTSGLRCCTAVSCWTQTAVQWRRTLITSSLRTPTVPAHSSWTTWQQMILASTCALPPVQPATPALWARSLSRVNNVTT